ncbi:MAG: hypothetical protein DRO11_09215 [Methanobacteriota archaeon]|nr:MAG: hypothetical protein DRO11_09215 [Euryarchaeota archaeon]
MYKKVIGTDRPSSTLSMSFQEVVVVPPEGGGMGSNAIPFSSFCEELGIKVEYSESKDMMETTTVILHVPEDFKGKILQRSGVFSRGRYQISEYQLYP